MELTKFAHACFTLELDGKVLVVDPGNMTSDFTVPENVVGIVCTHKHGDHFDEKQVMAITEKNPDALLHSVEAVISETNATHTQLVQPGESYAVGPFSLEFFGGKHASMHRELPIDDNVGVMINELVYFPGDSFVSPERPVDTLALPISAPWLKFGETMDHLRDIKPRLTFPTHDAILSSSGKDLLDMMLGSVAKDNAITYQRLNDPIDI